jgi:hypothetical protein
MPDSSKKSKSKASSKPKLPRADKETSHSYKLAKASAVKARDADNNSDNDSDNNNNKDDDAHDGDGDGDSNGDNGEECMWLLLCVHFAHNYPYPVVPYKTKDGRYVFILDPATKVLTRYRIITKPNSDNKHPLQEKMRLLGNGENKQFFLGIRVSTPLSITFRAKFFCRATSAAFCGPRWAHLTASGGALQVRFGHMLPLWQVTCPPFDFYFANISLRHMNDTATFCSLQEAGQLKK